ncbi:hypothetical protein ACFFX1_36975 [Dactylosporangium sucinum]|uniref:hypothetical protein n=1 Tax=Dactylosporangium sucinum TaxID=1424081 RepID=UPI003570A222
MFRWADLRACTARQQRTEDVDGKGRHLLLPEPLQELQTRARAQHKTPEWKTALRLRAGCEATVSEAGGQQNERDHGAGRSASTGTRCRLIGNERCASRLARRRPRRCASTIARAGLEVPA